MGSLYCTYGMAWYFWIEAHEYVLSPFSVFLCGVGIISDFLYPFVLWRTRNTERILRDGRKVRGDIQRSREVDVKNN
jgi:hypothetical protein